MKKIMIAAAIVCAAAFANAATCDWSGMMGASSGKGGTGAYTAYLIQTSVSADTAIAAIYAGTFSDYLATTTTMAMGPTMYSINVAGGDMKGNWVSGNTIDAYTIVVDDSVKTSENKLYYSTTAAAPTATVNDSLVATFAFGALSGYTWNTYSQSVPEPTSGLLLLLGVAGLALRRRHA